jgi:alkylation response protein AidB-like acyl-CoA dehydrogenase
VDFEPSEEQRAFQDAARAFAAGELTPHAARWDEEKHFPRATIAAAGELGFCGLYCPEALGGLGLSRLDAGLILEELAMGCTSTAAFISIHNMATWMACTWGGEWLRETFCRRLIRGELLASYCLTEPNAGSDAASLTTRAERDGDDYRIEGGKAFISGAGATDVLVLMARTGAPDSGARGISAFAIPADAPGISYGKNEIKLGWNSQPTRTIAFDGVRVPAACRLGAEGEGFGIAMRGLDGGRINIAACSLGAAQAALDHAQRHVRERRQFGRALAEFQALQFKLADMATELVAARQLVRLAASKLDRDDPDKTVYCAMAKRFATDIGFRVCNEALQLHGGYGYLREYPLERLLRDARVHQILEGTNEIMRVIVARRILEPGATEIIR